MTQQDLNEHNIKMNPYDNERYEKSDNICES